MRRPADSSSHDSMLRRTPLPTSPLVPSSSDDELHLQCPRGLRMLEGLQAALQGIFRFKEYVDIDQLLFEQTQSGLERAAP